MIRPGVLAEYRGAIMATMRTRSVTALLALGLLGLGPVSSATPSDQVPPRSFTIAATGDVMVHRSIAAVADQHTPGWNTYDFSPMLAAIEPWISGADLAICQMEMTMSATNQGLSYYPRFVVPHELADAVAGAGFDACSTASNHSIDGGMETLSQTIELLAAVGVATTGTARTAEERFPNLYDVNGVTVGHMAYTYSLNGLPLPEPWAVNVIEVDAILEDARWAREHGAEFVILSIHWGNEYQSAPSTWQIALAERL
ncbi:MAG: CapA family protein, partial [Acidimicrobiia bacterium]|nr:CapA family protein [Acidimicrobiia bacterium]